MFINFHYRCLISASIAIVRSRKNGTNMFIMAPVITLKVYESLYIVNELMGSCNHNKPVCVIELL